MFFQSDLERYAAGAALKFPGAKRSSYFQLKTMNANDHARAKTLTVDLEELQRILRRWAHENQTLADENEQLRARIAELKPLPVPAAEDPTYLTLKQLGERWGMHAGSILRKIRSKEFPCFRLNGRSIRIAMADVLKYEAANHFQ